MLNSAAPCNVVALSVGIRVFFRSRRDTALDSLALRALLDDPRQCWSRWTDAPVLVRPDTVIGWHRAGFRIYWRWRSHPGRPTEDHRGDSRSDPTLGAKNQGRGAPKIHAELQKLGFVISERVWRGICGAFAGVATLPSAG